MFMIINGYLCRITSRLYGINGIDVSHYQGSIDWQVIEEQGIDFAYIKATEGSSYVDDRFAENWEEAGNTHVLTGAYHFVSFESDVKTQTENYFQTVGDISGHLVPVLDVEYYGKIRKDPPSKDKVSRLIRDISKNIYDKYDVYPVIYSTMSFYLEYKEAFESNKDVFTGIWIRSVYIPPLLFGINDWLLWQFTDKAVLSGYDGDEKFIDMNVLREDDFNKILYNN